MIKQILTCEGTNWFSYDVFDGEIFVGTLFKNWDGWRWNYRVSRASDGLNFHSSKGPEKALRSAFGKVR